jgi:hypothetical protein
MEFLLVMAVVMTVFFGICGLVEWVVDIVNAHKAGKWARKGGK